jgi:hypothetical protein
MVVELRAVDDDEDEVVVDVDLRPLVELLGVLDSKRMELKTRRRPLKSSSVGRSRSSQKKSPLSRRPSTVSRLNAISAAPRA